MCKADIDLKYGARYKRFLAYLIDTLPILVIVFTILYFLGFKNVIINYFANPNNLENRTEFLAWRNWVRDLSFLVYVIYSVFLESSNLQGTLGKHLLGLKVIRDDFSPLTFTDSMKRNLFKIVSYLPLSLGFIWIFFSKKKKGWHDYFSKTIVIGK